MLHYTAEIEACAILSNGPLARWCEYELFRCISKETTEQTVTSSQIPLTTLRQALLYLRVRRHDHDSGQRLHWR